MKINYFVSGDHDERLMPLLYIPGALNDAEQALEMLDAFYPRKRVAISLRGRGKSEAPQSGYSLDDHASDIEAAVDAGGLADYCLMA
ncbi:MAG: alpha/beta fold hydrolase, partial [Lysinibacillus sp.]